MPKYHVVGRTGAHILDAAGIDQRALGRAEKITAKRRKPSNIFDAAGIDRRLIVRAAIIYDAPGIDRRVYGRAEGVNICDAAIHRRVIDTTMFRKTNKQTVSWVQDEIVLIGRDSIHRHGRLL